MTVGGGQNRPPHFVVLGERKEWREISLRDDGGNAVILDLDRLEHEPSERIPEPFADRFASMISAV